ncbi:2623_t:CDS:2 [Diversispora eburnea]|uniref:2623_t:CDS:1 n=1 Tax=Diversispora eburnea TaxID=1213867 RepID=A0A9N9FR14_9GLOM|nr:2623_t:CDS:2 [Diversispora eburnea]
MIQMKDRTLAQQHQWQIKYPGIESFVFNNKWVDCLMSRNNLSNRRRITIAQLLPDDLIEQQQEFLAFITYIRIQHDYPLTLVETGARTVSIRTTGHEKTNFTIVLNAWQMG